MLQRSKPLSSFAPALALLVSLLFPPSAAAMPEVQRRGLEIFPSANEVSVHLGYQVGFASEFGNPAGFKLFLEYSHRLPFFHGLLWLDAQVNPTFGGTGGGVCFDTIGKPSACGYAGGSGVEVAVGVKLKWSPPFGVPLVLEVPAAIAVEALYARACDDNGAAAPAIRVGIGGKYFLLKHLGLGLGVNVALGPAFHGFGDCRPYSAYADLYGAFDVQLGAEWIF